MPNPAPGRPGSRPPVLHQDVERESARYIDCARRIATELFNAGFDRHDCNAILRHAGAFVDVHFNNTHEGRRKSG